MSLAPLLNASPAIQIHAFAAMAAFALGVVQLAAPKGTLPHRTIGWIWVALMLAVSINLVLDSRVAPLGPLEPDPSALDLHLATLPLAVLHARRHRVANHRNAMIAIFTGALVIAGLFTFVPGRIMYAVVFGH